MIAPETVKVMQSLNTRGGEARFVGGCVRNALANRKVLDVDIATTLTPDQVIDRLDRAQIRHVPTGLLHGTVTAIVNGKTFEITTLRKDMRGYGRHADVLFTTDWRTDASRRDFTINTLYASMDGEIFDYYNGVEDLRQGRVIFVGDPEVRIREDILRILRFFRFHAHFGQGDINLMGANACEKLAPMIPKLSTERIRQEIFRLLEAESCPAVWQQMLQRRVVTYILPEATNITALKKLVRLEYIYQSESFPLRRIAALLDITPAGVPRVAMELKLSNEQGAQLVKMVDPGIPMHTKLKEADIRRAVYRFDNDIVRSLLLLSAAKAGEEGDLFKLYGEATSFRPPRFPLMGEDVMALGYAAGPEIGAILGAIEDWWLMQDFAKGRTACLEKLQGEYALKKA